MASIIIIGANGRTERPLEPHNTIGRHPSNTHQVLDRIVSKEHCHIDYVDGRYLLRDLGSLNGTFVNGERVGTVPLGHGDEISVGTTKILFQEHTAPATQPQQERQRPHSKVTMAPGMVESHIQSKLSSLHDQSFLPVHMVHDADALKQDYEKLRVVFEFTRAVGNELNVDVLLTKIVDCAFSILPADRGVILLYDENRDLKPRCVRTKSGGADEEVVLSTTIINQCLGEKVAVLSSDARLDSRFGGAHSIIMQGIRSSMAVPLLHGDDVFGVMVLDSQVASGAFGEKDLKLFQTVGNQAATAIQNSLYAQKLKNEAVARESLKRLLPPQIAEQVMSGKYTIQKGGEMRQTTVLFSDIRGFTSMSESRSPQEIVDMLNEYFELMVDVLFHYEGTLDKFVGDEIMALFGAPVARANDPYRAVKCALDMKRVLGEFNERRAAAGRVPVNVGFGINTGDVVAGYLGSSKALEYTVIGDAVNTGARLCSAAKANEILISAHTYNQVSEHFEVERLEPVHAKGKANALEVYKVLRERPSDFSDRTRPR